MIGPAGHEGRGQLRGNGSGATISDGRRPPSSAPSSKRNVRYQLKSLYPPTGDGEKSTLAERAQRLGIRYISRGIYQVVNKR